MTKTELALALAQELIRKSGVTPWSSPQERRVIAEAAIEMAELIWTRTQETRRGATG